jgi:hypothetical protein
MRYELTKLANQRPLQRRLCSDQSNLPIECLPEFGAQQGIELNMTEHAIGRFSQRGLQNYDAELIMAVGSETSAGFMITEKDLANFERKIKDAMKKVRRLKNKHLIVDGSVIITAYHATRKQQSKIL